VFSKFRAGTFPDHAAVIKDIQALPSK